MSKYTAEQIATNYFLWCEYVDTSGVWTFTEFEATPVSEKIDTVEYITGSDRLRERVSRGANRKLCSGCTTCEK